MTQTPNNFVHSATIAIADIGLKKALDRANGNSVASRLRGYAETTDAPALRQQARAARLRALNKLPELLETLEKRLTENGAHVLWAANGEECNQLVVDIARKHDVHKIVKGKSMATEETELNHKLEAEGLEVVETDLGEFVAQLAQEKPSHIVGPIIHMSKERVSDLFVEHLGIEPTSEPRALTKIARIHLRQKYIHADMGITGANFAIAETGTLAIVTNEGNGRMVGSLPRVHVVVVGIEKVIETPDDFGSLVQMLVRANGGGGISVYVQLISGPARVEDLDGPEEMYVILLDNGRSRIHGQEDYAEMLACLRCGACLNNCPVYQNVGGHAYGSVYSGPMGAVITPLMFGLENATPLPHASSLCGACKEACPVDIDIPRMLLKLRGDLVEAGKSDRTISLGIKGWAIAMKSPLLYAASGTMARGLTRIQAGKGGVLHKLPGPLGNWTKNRDFPAFAPQSFHQMWVERKKAKLS